MQGRKKKFLLLGGSALLLIVLGFGVFSLFHKQSAKKTTVGNTTATKPKDVVGANLVVKDFDTPSAADVKKTAKSPADAYSYLLLYGQQKMRVSKYIDAYSYFEAASAVDGISQEQKNSAYFGEYSAATGLKDTVKQKAARTAMGEAAYATYTQPNQGQQ